MVEQIDEDKTRKYSLVWYLSTAVLIFAVVYFVGIIALSDFIKTMDVKVWTVSYKATQEEQTNLPVIILNIAGIDSNLVKPYTISKKTAKGDGAVLHEFCAPQFFPDDCWGNPEVNLNCKNKKDALYFTS